jgi:hypothetical protein
LNQHRARVPPDIRLFDPLTAEEISSASDARSLESSRNPDDSSESASEQRAARSAIVHARSELGSYSGTHIAQDAHVLCKREDVPILSDS